MSPSHCAGRSPSSRECDHDSTGSPTQITAAEATTTRIAAVPGIGVFASKTSEEASNTARAAHPRTLRSAGRPAATGAKASSAPAPNSQARAVVAK